MTDKREYLQERPGVTGEARSTWLVDAEREPYPKLAQHIKTDVAVVGAGLTGVLTALRLAEAGSSVALLEGRRIGSDVSGHTTAKLTAQHELVSDLADGDDAVRWFQANLQAVERVAQRCAQGGDAAEFARTDCHVYVNVGGDMQSLAREAELYARAGAKGELIEAGLPEWMGGAVRLRDQATFHPVRLIDTLVEQLVERGAQVFEGCLIDDVDDGPDGVTACSGRLQVKCDSLVVATHVPFFDTLLYSTRLYQYRAYAFEVECSEPLTDGMWIGHDGPALTWRRAHPDDPSRYIISGGEEHKAGHNGDQREFYRTLEQAARDRLPITSVLRHWSTQDARTPDGLPYIGKMHGRQRCFVASGFNGWGMTRAEVAADVLAALVQGQEHPLADLVSPARITAEGFGSFAFENIDFVGDSVRSAVVGHGDPQAVPEGEGATMRSDAGHVAVFAEPGGTRHVLDAHCTHMRCGVAFNTAEGTWDCPCHGSRFLADGSWLHGPAKRPLEKVSD